MKNNIQKEIAKIHKDFYNKHNQLMIKLAILALVNSFKNGNKTISCGNGGSMCDAMHFAEELTGKFKHPRNAISAIAISDPAHLSCVANDFGYDYVFSRYLDAHGYPNDVLIAISTSGNSENIINAIRKAKNLEMKVIGLLGKDGGNAKNLVDYPIVVPSDKSERIQEIHIQIIHTFIEGIEQGLKI